MPRCAYLRFVVLSLIALLFAAQVAQADVPRPLYDLHLNLDYAHLTYQGTADVTVPVADGDALKDVVFHLYANADGVPRADNAHPNLVVQSVTGDSHDLVFSQNGTALHVTLPASSKSTFVKVHLSWRGAVPQLPTPPNALADLMPGDLGDVLGGNSAEKASYRDYGLYSSRNGIVSLGTYWFPMLALRSGGKWQTEIAPGPGDLGVAAASDYRVAVEVANAPDALSIITPRKGAKAPTLISQIDGARDFPVVIAENFSVQSRNVVIDGRTVEVSSWARNPNSGKATQILDVAANALPLFSKRFGAYPWDHFTVVQGSLSGGAGGAEFSGLAIIAQALYADLDKELTDMLGPLGQNSGILMQQQLKSIKSLLETTVAHETAHQWWGIGVGSDVRREPWLDESLTNYCAALYYKDRYKDQRYTEMVQANLTQPYQMARFLGLPDMAVNSPTNEFVNDLQYGAIVYGKGALFYQALHSLMGDSLFNTALQKYFSTYHGKMATTTDLMQLFQKADPAHEQEIAKLYQHWIQESHGDEDIGTVSLMDLLGAESTFVGNSAP